MNSKEEWCIELPSELVAELEDSFASGPIIDDKGTHLLLEQEFDRLDGLKIELFSKEHPPPHFRVYFQGISNSFTIEDCTPMHGDALKKYFRNIKKWHKDKKQELIDFWNTMRPTDCPVGVYRQG